MKTERELLEFAAKAAGYDYEFGIGRRTDPDFNEYVAWNPLTDDGDALRLANKLRINIEHHSDQHKEYTRAGTPTLGWYVENHPNIYWPGLDDNAKNRIAIVRAAAAIGGWKA